MKIVIVEDEIRIREGLVKLIKRFFTEVSEVRQASSGEEGLTAVRELKPDIVFTDIKMEPMDGLEMLRQLNAEKKWNFKTVILSAYSEFEYAKQAISLGVNEYLIKPVDIDEFQKLMHKLESELAEEKRSRTDNPKQLRSMETIINGVISGQMEVNEDLEGFIVNNYGIPCNREMAILSIYLGRRYEEEIGIVLAILQNCLVKKGYQKYQFMKIPAQKELLTVFFSPIKMQEVKRYLQYNLLQELHKINPSATAGFAVCDNFREIKHTVEKLREVLPWSISLGSDVLIVYPKVLECKTAELIYPSNLEKACVDAFCKMDYNCMNKCAEKFLQYFTVQPYAPEAIKKSVLRFIWTMLNMVKELNYQAYIKMDEKNLMETVGYAMTFRELETVVYTLLEVIMQRQEKSVGLIVQKAQRMVEEFYSQGITLEEIAANLGVTPEHVSAQFHKDLGVNFSTYYRDYRLAKAKELLIGTDLKMYQVAEKAGYRDAKYFSKIFKEVEGVLPVKYRQNYR